LLISVTGFSPRTTILAFKVLRPRRLVVIPSENARGSINTIARYVVGEGGLQQADFSQRPCVPTNPLSIYNVVKDELELLERQDGQAISYIDITGGRKVMSATAALAAWQLDLGLCYLDGEYDPELRQAVPGSDRLLLLDNPTSLFGEQEMNAAYQAFDGGAYEAAGSRFEELSGRLARPTDARFWGALSKLYGAWCDLDLVALPAAIETVRRTLGRCGSACPRPPSPPWRRSWPSSTGSRTATRTRCSCPSTSWTITTGAWAGMISRRCSPTGRSNAASPDGLSTSTPASTRSTPTTTWSPATSGHCGTGTGPSTTK
jgi:hypothetical protein